MHHRSATWTLVATMTDRRDILECSRPTSRRVRDVKRRKLLGAVLARVRKREVNANVPTIHPRPLITPKITTSYPHALLATRSSLSRGLLDHERRLELHEGHALFKAWLAKALAEETGRLQTCIYNHSLRPLLCSFLTPQSPRLFEQPMLLVAIVDPVFEVATSAIYVERRIVGAIHKKR